MCSLKSLLSKFLSINSFAFFPYFTTCIFIIKTHLKWSPVVTCNTLVLLKKFQLSLQDRDLIDNIFKIMIHTKFIRKKRKVDNFFVRNIVFFSYSSAVFKQDCRLQFWIKTFLVEMFFVSTNKLINYINVFFKIFIFSLTYEKLRPVFQYVVFTLQF